MPHYRIVMTERRLNQPGVISEVLLREKFDDHRMCNQRIKQIAEAQKKIYPTPAIRVQHNAGLSVAYYKRGFYTEYSRSELLYDDNER